MAKKKQVEPGDPMQMNNCWMDTDGKLYEVQNEESHEDAAKRLLGDEEISGTAEMTLHERGWVRFSTNLTPPGYAGMWYWLWAKHPTEAQLNKMYELTGFVYDESKPHPYDYQRPEA